MLRIAALSEKSEPELKIGKITLLGDDGEITWARDNKTLSIAFPKKKPCSYAYVVRVEKQSHNAPLSGVRYDSTRRAGTEETDYPVP